MSADEYHARQRANATENRERERAWGRSGGTTPEGVRWMRHSFPLRPDFTVTLELPRDLTTDEARRIGAMLLTIAPDAHG